MGFSSKCGTPAQASGLEDPERLFQFFYTTKPQGMGMGLPICRSIIEARGGRLWAAPIEPEDALFGFTLPSEEQPS